MGTGQRARSPTTVFPNPWHCGPLAKHKSNSTDTLLWVVRIVVQACSPFLCMGQVQTPHTQSRETGALVSSQAFRNADCSAHRRLWQAPNRVGLKNLVIRTWGGGFNAAGWIFDCQGRDGHSLMQKESAPYMYICVVLRPAFQNGQSHRNKSCGSHRKAGLFTY